MMSFPSRSPGQPPDGELDVPAEPFGQAGQLKFLRLLGGVAIILLGGDLRGVDRRLRAAQTYPHLLVSPGGAVGHVDGEDLRTLLVGQPEQGLDVVEPVHVLALVQQDLAVAVVDDGALDDGGRDDVIDLLGDYDCLAEELPDRLEEVFQILGHALLADGLPRLLQQDHLADTLQLSHLVDERLHDDDRDYREEHLVVLDVVQLEDDEPLAEKVQLLVGVEQVVVLTALVIRLQHVQETPHVEVLLAGALGLQDFPVLVADELIERVEGWDDGPVRADLLQEEADRIGESNLLGACRRLVVPFPQREDERLDGLLLLYVEDPVLHIEGIEGYRVALLVGEIDAVLTVCAGVDKAAESLVGVTGVHQQHMRSLLVIMAHHVVGEEGLAAAGRTEYELVAVGYRAVPHRQVGDVQVDRLPGQPVHHADAEGRERVPAGCLPDEQAQGLLDEGVEALLRRKIACIARYRRPKQGRHVNCVVPRLALHQGELAAHVVLDALELLPVVAPGEHVAVRAHGGEALAVRLVQVPVYPFLVDLVGTAVAGERVHVPGGLLELPQCVGRTVDEHILVHHMAAHEQDAYRCGEGEAAVAAVRGEPLIAAVSTHAGRQVLRVGQGVQAEQAVPDPHFPGPEGDVLKAGAVILREREVLLDDARGTHRAGYLIFRKSHHADQAAVVHDTLELPAALHEPRDGLPVLHLLWDYEPAREGIEAACRAAVLPRGLGQEQVAGVPQVRTLVEVPLKAAAEETPLLTAGVGPVALLDEYVLLMHYAVLRKDLDGLHPCGMECLVLGARQSEHLRELHPVGHGDVRVLADDAPVLDGHQRETALQRGGFHYISHTLFPLGLLVSSRMNLLRLMM